MTFASGLITGLVALGVLVLSVLGGLYVTPWVLRAAARRSQREGEGDPTPAPGPVPPPPPPPGPPGATVPPDPAGAGGPTGSEAVQALRGGTWIGILERLAITGCLLAGYPAGIAFVVAIKGLGRYPELREHPVASERFMIGTLASMTWAGATGLLGAALLGLLR